MISFEAAQHTASFVAIPPKLPEGARGIAVVVASPRNLRRGPVKYEGGYKQQKLAASVFPFNTRRDFFAAGLALNAGGGRGCQVRHGSDVCRTILGTGFLRLRDHRWKKLEISLFKPARQPVTVRIWLRTLREIP